MKRIFIVGMLLLALVLNTKAQMFTIETKVNKTSIQTGEPFQVSISLMWLSAFYQLKPHAIPDTLGPFEHLPDSLPDGQFEGEHNKQTLHLNFTAFEPGSFTLPPIPITFYSPSTNSDTVLYSMALPITVTSPIVDTTQPFKPIQPIEEALLPWQERVKQWGLYALIALALLGILYWFFRRKKKIPEQPKTEPAISPYQKTLRIFNRLQSECQAPPQGEKYFYSELSDALRTYLEQAFNLACLDKTTNEIIQSVQQNSTLRPHTQLVQSILEQADFIKFAKGISTTEKRQHDILNAIHVLEHTQTKNE